MSGIETLSRDVLEDIFEGRPNPMAGDFQMYSLMSPGMPVPGPDFVTHAQALGDQLALKVDGTGANKRATEVGWFLKCLYLRALYDDNFHIPIDVKGTSENVRVVPGHLWDYAVTGPRRPGGDRPCVMMIGKMPTMEEVRAGRNMVGPTGSFFVERLEEMDVEADEYGSWYVCNLVRWMQVDPRGGSLPSRWIKDCLPLLHQELRLIRPDYILCVGAESTKEVCGTGNNVRNMFGRWIETRIPLHDIGEDPVYHTAKVMAIMQPKLVMTQTELRPQFDRQLENFVRLTRGQEFSDGTDKYTIRYIYKERDLQHYVDWILAQPGLKKIAIDGEWHGDHPGEPGAYLRTVQICHDGRNAAVIVLKNQGGSQAFQPGNSAAMRQLTRLLDRDDIQIIGHFLASDFPWLVSEGLDVRQRFRMPMEIEAARGGYAGGFDTALALHAYDETGDYKLEVACSRWLGARRWDVDLGKWKKEYCNTHKITEAQLEGYGECPFEILGPYSAYDVIYCWQLAEMLQRKNGMLDSDRYKNASWGAFRTNMIAFTGFLEMGMTGVKIDRQRIDDLTDNYGDVRTRRLRELRIALNWPDFNPRSHQQCAELLFGEGLNQKKRRDPTVPERIRPEGAASLYLTPIKTTKDKPWEQIMAHGEEQRHAPSTDKETLGILGAQQPLAMMLRDVRFIDHVLKSVLKPPRRESDDSLMLDDDGQRVYEKGIASFICHDDRVRSTFLQTKETGRASSARPPLQNLSKRRETDYKRIQGDSYRWKIRSFIVSDYDHPTEPTVLLETDYGGAELLGMAVYSRGQSMIDHCMDDDYDIHSHIAVEAFGLTCPPTKKSFTNTDVEGLRVAAKNIIFGVGYGRGAAACARQCKEEGNDISEAQAQVIIDTIFNRYPEIPDFQQACKDRVLNPGWMKNCFGRYRRFIPSNEWGALAGLEREAMNFPMQSMVADAVSWALYYLSNHPRKAELGYRIVLQIHDAIVLEVPTRSLDVVYNEIIPECMVDRVPFRSCDLDGNPYRNSPEYRFPIARDVQVRWGESLTTERCDQLKISHVYAEA